MSLSQPPQIEARFIELMSQLFQLREAEQLDFGIYRLIRRHNRRIREFLGIDDQGRRVPEGGSIDAIYKLAFETVELAHAEESKRELARLTADTLEEAIARMQVASRKELSEHLSKNRGLKERLLGDIADPERIETPCQAIWKITDDAQDGQ